MRVLWRYRYAAADRQKIHEDNDLHNKVEAHNRPLSLKYNPDTLLSIQSYVLSQLPQ